MADRRRRRNSVSESDTEVQIAEAPSELDVKDAKPDATVEPPNKPDGDAEGGSQDEESEDSDDSTGSNDSEDGEDDDQYDYISGDEEGEAGGTNAEAPVVDDGVDEERQSGDGEEQAEERLDDDEDTKNPAYIPRKGAFYEHDTRLGDDAGDVVPNTEVKLPEDASREASSGTERPRKKLWSDADKWLHDRYDDSQQRPKSHAELVSIYGYDIRERDSAPDGNVAMAHRRGRPFSRSRQPNRISDYVHDTETKNRGPRRSSLESDREEHDQGRYGRGHDDEGRVGQYDGKAQRSWERQDRGGKRGASQANQRRPSWQNEQRQAHTDYVRESMKSGDGQSFAVQAALAKEIVAGTVTAGGLQREDAQLSATSAVMASIAQGVTNMASGLMGDLAAKTSAATNVPVQADQALPNLSSKLARGALKDEAGSEADVTANAATQQLPQLKSQPSMPASQPSGPEITKKIGVPSSGMQTQQQAKPKRYSSQRQRGAAAPASGIGSADSAANYAGHDFYPAQLPPPPLTAPLTALPQQQQIGSAPTRGHVHSSATPAAVPQSQLPPHALQHPSSQRPSSSLVMQNPPLPYGAQPMPGGPMHSSSRMMFVRPPHMAIPPGSSASTDQLLGQAPQYLSQPGPGLVSSPAGGMMGYVTAAQAHSTLPAAQGPTFVMQGAGSMPMFAPAVSSRPPILAPQSGQEGYSLGGTTYYGPSAAVMTPTEVIGPAQYFGDAGPAAPLHNNIVYYSPVTQQTGRTPPGRRQKAVIPIVRPEERNLSGGDDAAVAARLAPLTPAAAMPQNGSMPPEGAVVTGGTSASGDRLPSVDGDGLAYHLEGLKSVSSKSLNDDKFDIIKLPGVGEIEARVEALSVTAAVAETAIASG